MARNQSITWRLGPAVAVALMAITSGGSDVRADEKADALLKEVQAASKAVKSLTADLVLSREAAQQKVSAGGTVKLMKPNLALIQIGAPLSQTVASDGETLWNLMEARNQFTKTKADAEGANIMAAWALPVLFFFNFTIPDGMDSTLVGTQTIEGQEYRVVQLVPRQQPTTSVRLYIGEDNLIHRVSQEQKAGAAVSRLGAAFKNVKTDVPLGPTDFTYRPPATAKILERPSYEANLVPVGQKAPVFSLAAPGGGRISLADQLQGKKAVLINFWFYG